MFEIKNSETIGEPIVFKNIIRLGYANEDIDHAIPHPFQALCIQRPASESLSLIMNQTESLDKLIELIIIPDRYLSDVEVLQTIQVRDEAHTKKNGLGIIITATDARQLLAERMFTSEFCTNVYKISTIRHGFQFETTDENTDLLINLSNYCVDATDSKLCEIVIRACYSAGSLNTGLADPVTSVPIGQLYKATTVTPEDAAQSRSFLHGQIGTAGTEKYKTLKQLTIRTQTLSLKNVALLSPTSNVVYSLRETLNRHPKLRHLSVKAYYEVVNPVPEEKPTRMGFWSSPRREALLSYPKAIRLLSPDYPESIEEKPNHFTRAK